MKGQWGAMLSLPKVGGYRPMYVSLLVASCLKHSPLESSWGPQEGLEAHPQPPAEAPG